MNDYLNQGVNILLCIAALLLIIVILLVIMINILENRKSENGHTFRNWLGSRGMLSTTSKPVPAPQAVHVQKNPVPRVATSKPKEEQDPVQKALDEANDTNISYDTSISSVRDAQHLTNLWRHMNRTARKYDSVRDHVREQTILPLKEGEQYRPTLVHMFVTAKYSGPRTETDEILWRICVLSAKHVCEDYPKQVIACTVVAGEQPDGTQIMPCIHLIADVKDLNEAKLIANSLLATDIKDSDLK